jgi:hypothetical protein
MTNTRNRVANENNGNNNTNPPPPAKLEQVLIMQAQMPQTMQQTMANMQQAPQYQLAPLQQRCDKLGEFQQTKSLTFSHFVEPMDADDWLKIVEKSYKLFSATTETRFCLQHISWSDLLQTSGMHILKPTRNQKLSTCRNSRTSSEVIMC